MPFRTESLSSPKRLAALVIAASAWSLTTAQAGGDHEHGHGHAHDQAPQTEAFYADEEDAERAHDGIGDEDAKNGHHKGDHGTHQSRGQGHHDEHAHDQDGHDHEH